RNNATARLAESVAVRAFFASVALESFGGPVRESSGTAARTEKRNTSPLSTKAMSTPAHFDQTTGSRWKRCGIVRMSIHRGLVYPSARWPAVETGPRPGARCCEYRNVMNASSTMNGQKTFTRYAHTASAAQRMTNGRFTSKPRPESRAGGSVANARCDVEMEHHLRLGRPERCDHSRRHACR